eukprot:759461-Hanusia_phi.AAC.3
MHGRSAAPDTAAPTRRAGDDASLTGEVTLSRAREEQPDEIGRLQEATAAISETSGKHADASRLTSEVVRRERDGLLHPIPLNFRWTTEARGAELEERTLGEDVAAEEETAPSILDRKDVRGGVHGQDPVGLFGAETATLATMFPEDSVFVYGNLVTKLGCRPYAAALALALPAQLNFLHSQKTSAITHNARRVLLLNVLKKALDAAKRAKVLVHARVEYAMVRQNISQICCHLSGQTEKPFIEVAHPYAPVVSFAPVVKVFHTQSEAIRVSEPPDIPVRSLV